MTNVAHSSLTGSNLHEPKGVATATSGQVYIANGSGSGVWTDVSITAPGMIADFFTPVAPTGWLELDGSSISTTTYSALFTALTIQQSGARGVGSPIISTLSSTANMKIGYFVAGAGIPSGAKILTVDSSTQITLDQNASSSGTNTVYVSPCALAAGTTPATITLPNATTSGRYRRSRTSGGSQIGVVLSDSIKNHTHTVSGNTGGQSVDHTHSGTTTGVSADHTHSTGGGGNFLTAGNTIHNIRGDFQTTAYGEVGSTSGASADHTHNYTTSGFSQDHIHSFSVTSANNSGGDIETRPLTLVCMTCIKT